jgi:hypothetical protein
MSDGDYAVLRVWEKLRVSNNFNYIFLKIGPNTIKYWAVTTVATTDNKWFATVEDAKDVAEGI